VAQAVADGAIETLIALQTPSPRGYTGIPILLWGKPGTGKSSFVESLADEGFPVVTIIASIHDPTDFSGMPVMSDGRVRFAPPEWCFAFSESEAGILFLDELTTAPPAVQAALLRVVLERRVGFQPLPKGVRVIAAANPPEMVSGGWELSPPLRNRFVHIQWHLSPQKYVQSLQDGFAKMQLPAIDPAAHAALVLKWKAIADAFLRRNSTLTYGDPNTDGQAFATPRTWDYAVHLLASCELLGLEPVGSVAQSLVRGCVGEAPAIGLLQFLKQMSLPDPAELLEGTVKLPAKLREDELYILFAQMTNLLIKRSREGESVLDATEQYLGYLFSIISKGKLDTVFSSFKRLAEADILEKAYNEADSCDRGREHEKLLRRLADHPKFRDFANYLSPPRND